MIDLDQMKTLWAQQTALLNHQLLASAQLQRAESRIQRLKILTYVHAAAWAVCIALLGNFLYENAATPHLAIAAFAVDLYAIGWFIALIRQIVMIQRIDYAQPLTAIQKQLEALRITRIRTIQWGVLAGVIVWAPAAMVAVHCLLAFDLYEATGPAWIWANILFGLAVLAISRKLGGRLNRYPAMQHFLNDLAGRNLTAAAAFLAGIAEFESEVAS